MPGNSKPPLLKTLSPTASMWSRPGMTSACAPGISAASASGRAGDRVVAADRDQYRHRDAADLVAAERLARTAHAGGERPQIGPGLFGEGAKHIGRRIGDRVPASAPRAPRAIVSGSPTPSTRLHAEPAEHRRAHPFGMRQRQKCRDPRAHRITHDVGAREAEMIDQRAHIFGHDASCDRRRGRRACVDWPWPRLSSAMTRRPARVNVVTQPGATQFTSFWTQSRGRARSAHPRLRRGKRSPHRHA